MEPLFLNTCIIKVNKCHLKLYFEGSVCSFQIIIVRYPKANYSMVLPFCNLLLVCTTVLLVKQ